MEWRLRFGSVLVACTLAVSVAAQESARLDPPTTATTSVPDTAVSFDSFVGAPPDLFDTAAPEPAPIFDQIGQPQPAPPTPRHTGIKAMINSFPSGHAADTMAFATGAAPELAVVAAGVHVRVVRGDLAVARQRPLLERRHGRLSGRHYRGADGDAPRADEFSG
jgi:hypothetical protein